MLNDQRSSAYLGTLQAEITSPIHELLAALPEKMFKSTSDQQWKSQPGSDRFQFMVTILWLHLVLYSYLIQGSQNHKWITNLEEKILSKALITTITHLAYYFIFPNLLNLQISITSKFCSWDTLKYGKYWWFSCWYNLVG